MHAHATVMSSCVLNLLSVVNFSHHIYVLYVAAQARSTSDKDGSEEDEYNEDEYDEDEYDEDEVEEDEEEEDEEEEEDSKPRSGLVQHLSKKFSNMSTSTSGKQATGNLKTPNRPKKVDTSKFQMHLPFIVYQWSDRYGQEHVSADIWLLSGMQHDCINPKISKCGLFLEIRLKIPDPFFSPIRLGLKKDNVKAISLMKEANAIKEKYAKSSDSYHVWVEQRIKLPFKVQPHFAKTFTDAGIETVIVTAGTLGNGVVTSVVMVADKVAIKRDAILSPPVRVAIPEHAPQQQPRQPSPSLSSPSSMGDDDDL